MSECVMVLRLAIRKSVLNVVFSVCSSGRQDNRREGRVLKDVGEK